MVSLNKNTHIILTSLIARAWVIAGIKRHALHAIHPLIEAHNGRLYSAADGCCRWITCHTTRLHCHIHGMWSSWRNLHAQFQSHAQSHGMWSLWRNSHAQCHMTCGHCNVARMHSFILACGHCDATRMHSFILACGHCDVTHMHSFTRHIWSLWRNSHALCSVVSCTCLSNVMTIKRSNIMEPN